MNPSWIGNNAATTAKSDNLPLIIKGQAYCSAIGRASEMSKSQNDVAAKSINANEAALRDLEALAAEWVERQRQQLKVASH